MTKSKNLGIMACTLTIILFQTSCSRQSVAGQSHFESEISNAMINSTTENTTADSVSEIQSSPQTQIETDENGIPQEIPPITISYDKGQSTITYAFAKNQWNGFALKRESLFLPERTFGGVFSNHHMMPDDPTQLILVDFTPYSPDEVTIKEHIFLINNEQEAYQGDSNIITSTQVSEGIWKFTAELTSDGKVGFMGYSITAKWGENICEYAFLFNTRVGPEDCE